MFVLRGFKTDSIQETHPWHCRDVDSKKIDLSLAVENHGNDKSQFGQEGNNFLFHAPLFGGWKEFSVYEVEDKSDPFYIGWIIHDSKDDNLMACQINKLPISGGKIRMLDGNKNTWGYFFAVNSKGEQVKLTKLATGNIGDGTFESVRIF
jgi:hypothetical protein